MDLEIIREPQQEAGRNQKNTEIEMSLPKTNNEGTRQDPQGMQTKDFSVATTWPTSIGSGGDSQKSL